MLKHIRITSDGVIVDADRSVHTTRRGEGGLDKVQWQVQGAGNEKYQIRFGYLSGSPFQAESPHIIDLPHPPLAVSQDPRRYKYDVLKNGTVTDDPDVIIDS